MNKNDILKFIDENFESYTEISDKIWENPELRFDLGYSADRLVEKLEEEGFTIQRDVADMEDAFVATYGSGKPVIGFLGEYDALSNVSQVADKLEKEELKPECPGHGCGHHLLGVGSLLSAVAVKEYFKNNKLEGTIKYFGCPAEESGSGKAYMARAGIFDDSDSIITWHPMNDNKVWGESSLANYQIYFNFKGISSHASAAPEYGRSALDACELMNVGVNYLREHIVDDARVHYAYIDAGGTAPNVVQPTASILYYIRAPKSSQVKEIYERVVKIAKGAALMTETELEIKWDSAAAEYIVNRTLAEVMYKNMEEIEVPSYTEEELKYAQDFQDTIDKEVIEREKQARRDLLGGKIDKKELEEELRSPIFTKLHPLLFPAKLLMGSTDVGDASYNAPTVQLLSASYSLGAPSHSWQWVAMGKSSVAKKGMNYASKVMAQTAIDLIENPELIQKAKEEFIEKVGKDGYQSPIPAEVKPK